MKIFALQIALCVLLKAGASFQTGLPGEISWDAVAHFGREYWQHHPQVSFASSSHQQVHQPTLYDELPTFHELVYARPLSFARSEPEKSRKESEDHARAFANRPEIRAIEVNDPKTENIGKALYSLREGIRDRLWQTRFHLSVDKWLDDNNVDQKRKQAIKGYLRARTRREVDHRRMEKDRLDGNKRERKRVSRNEQRQVYRQQPPQPTLAVLLDNVTAGKKLSAFELVDIAEGLRGNLQKPSGFGISLMNYLKAKGFSAEQIDAAVGSKLVDRTKAWNRRQHEKNFMKKMGNPLMLKLSSESKDEIKQRMDQEGRSKYLYSNLHFADLSLDDPHAQYVSTSDEKGQSAVSNKGQASSSSSNPYVWHEQRLPPKKRKSTFPPPIGNRIPMPNDDVKDDTNKDGLGCNNWWDAPGCFYD